MKFSCICLTYGRTAPLFNAVTGFLAQNYPHAELIVFNTFKEQTLEIKHPRIIVHNGDRLGSLGETRNAAIKLSTGTHIVVWDDDCQYLPWYLGTFAEMFTDEAMVYLPGGLAWARQKNEFFAERYEIKDHRTSSPNTVAFAKWAWEKVGGYPHINVGEDGKFLAKLTEFPGSVKVMEPEQIGFIYGWDNGVHHISGHGDDKPGAMSSWERSKLALEQRVATKLEPVGIVPIEATGDCALEFQMRVRYLLKLHQQHDKPSVCVVQLGRFGDIINILPICQHIATNYGRPALMVSREFARILDGVSYVVPHVVDFRYEGLQQAMELAKSTYPNVVRCQIYGKGWMQAKLTEAYNIESWREAGFFHEFFDPAFLPVFDNRSPVMEAEVIRKVNPEGKLAIAVNVSGTSSPFPMPALLLAEIEKQFPDYKIIDLSKIILPRIFDLLGLLESCAAIVSVDTSTLHLAAATARPVPLIALVNPTPWAGTALRVKHATRINYDAACENYFSAAIDAIKKALKQPIGTPFSRIAFTSCPPKRRVFHCVERHEQKPVVFTGRDRVTFAQQSWEKLYAAGVIPAHYPEPYERNAKDVLGDPRPLPFIKDVLKAAMDKADDADIIMWTNDDNWLHPKLPEIVTFYCATWGACTAQRTEFYGATIPYDSPPEVVAERGKLHMGRDMFAATKAWLIKYWDAIPDFVLGASDFDLCLAALVRRERGMRTTGQNLVECMYPAEIPHGYVAHEYHPPKWMERSNVNTAPSQVHNRKLFAQWNTQHYAGLKFTQESTLQ